MNLINKIIYITIPVIIYLIIIFFSNGEKIIQNLSNLKLNYFLLFVGFWSLAVIPRIFRWNLFVGTITNKIHFSRNALYFLSGFSLLLSPGRMGEIIRAPFLKRDYEIPISRALSITIVERFYDLLASIIIISVALFFTNLPKTILIVPATTILIMIIIISNKKIFLKIAAKLQKIKYMKNIISNLDESFDTIFTLLKPKYFVIATSMTLSVVFFEAVGIFYLLKSLSTYVDFPTITAIFHISNFLGAVSMLPAGLGIQEGGFSGLLVLYKVPNDVAFSASLLFRVIATGMFTLVGLISLRIISKSSLR